MPTEPPPSRYRVVERGRRLEVIDTLAGEAPARPADATRPGTTIITHRWFDDKAPRRLRLDRRAVQHIDGAQTIAIGAAMFALIVIVFQPMLAIVLLPLLASRPRARLRATATAWIDRLDPIP